MKAPTAAIRISLTLLASAVLAACAVQPSKPVPSPAVVTALPAVPPPTTLVGSTADLAGQPWASIRESDVLQDCANAPLIRANATMYTRSPARFAQQLQQALPMIMYVQKELRANNIPGEFAMLPMLESSYRAAEPSRRGDAAGLWQFMPTTARHHGITVNGQYDGRLDAVASTKAAIKMLKSLHAEFGDWRLVDMAYNAGPYAIMGALRDHPNVGGAPLPNINVSHANRVHLARLMALSCVVRQPERFAVKLPKATPDDELAVVKVPAGSSFSQVADLAEISETKLRSLNPAYRSAKVPSASPRTLLLPADAAQALTAALTVNSSEAVAQINPIQPGPEASSALPLPVEPTPPPSDNSAPPPAEPERVTRHRVRSGDTLWSIAHRFHVSVGELRHWNHLRGNDVRIGEELRVHG